MGPMYRVLGKRGRITIPFEIRKRVGFAYKTFCPSPSRMTAP